MTLAIGSQLGGYEVTALIGRGGMGAVYRAHDRRLGRDVAIKVLPEALAGDADRAARFEREARVLASLNHPHIAAIYGVEDVPVAGQAPISALVLELVTGETLADRLVRGRLPTGEALKVAKQMAEALEAAHDLGIVHRDLKPANVKITSDGQVKVLDFGLAKLVDTQRDEQQIPTVTMSETASGQIWGTPLYMSPEQARGQALDKRTDIWSFGVVLFEMLTGKAAFAAATLSDTIVAVLTREVAWSTLPETTPPPVRTLLGRCLERDPRQRLRDIGDARLELEAVLSTPLTASGRMPAGSQTRPRWPRVLALAGLLTALIAFAVLASRSMRREVAPPAAAVHVTALLPVGVSLTSGPGMLRSLALSPDGSTLVIAGTDATGQRLYRRTLDRPDVTPIAGTEGALGPFFSPDGAWIGFFADRRLKRVPVAGGATLDVAESPGYPSGASWGTDNRIVFAAGYRSPLRMVDAGGGTPQQLTTVTTGPGHLYPEILPDARTVLFNEGRWVHALDLPSGRRTERLVEGLGARYTASGHLMVNRGGVLLAVPFDLPRLSITGQPAPVAQGVSVERGSGGVAHAALSRSGTLAYSPAGRGYALVLTEPDGTERVLTEDPLLENPQFSPDGKRLVVARTIRGDDAPQLWIYDLATQAAPFRLTSDGGRAPVWTPDGAAITYSKPVPGDGAGIYTQSADGRGVARVNVPLKNFHWLVGWTTRQLAYGQLEDLDADGITRGSIMEIAGNTSRRVVGPGQTFGGRLSPDGRWLAYYTLDSGYFEIYVTPFPETGARWLIGEGTDPSWSPDGAEIYYRQGGRLMAARLDSASAMRVLSRRLVVASFSPPLYDDYDIHPDGRLVLVQPVGDASRREITLVFNWPAELARLTRE